MLTFLTTLYLLQVSLSMECITVIGSLSKNNKSIAICPPSHTIITCTIHNTTATGFSSNILIKNNQCHVTNTNNKFITLSHAQCCDFTSYDSNICQPYQSTTCINNQIAVSCNSNNPIAIKWCPIFHNPSTLCCHIPSTPKTRHLLTNNTYNISTTNSTSSKLNMNNYVHVILLSLIGVLLILSCIVIWCCCRIYCERDQDNNHKSKSNHISQHSINPKQIPPYYNYKQQQQMPTHSQLNIMHSHSDNNNKQINYKNAESDSENESKTFQMEKNIYSQQIQPVTILSPNSLHNAHDNSYVDAQIVVNMMQKMSTMQEQMNAMQYKVYQLEHEKKMAELQNIQNIQNKAYVETLKQKQMEPRPIPTMNNQMDDGPMDEIIFNKNTAGGNMSSQSSDESIISEGNYGLTNTKLLIENDCKDYIYNPNRHPSYFGKKKHKDGQDSIDSKMSKVSKISSMDNYSIKCQYGNDEASELRK